MSAVHHAVRLSSPRAFGRHVPPASLGVTLRQVEVAVRRSVLMAFERRSVATGRHPGINAIFGKWPGAETDEEFSKAIEELS